MAALQTVRTRSSRPPIALASRTLAPVRPLDGAMDLALQLAVLRQRHALSVLAVTTIDGQVIASCGDAESARALATYAKLVLGRERLDAARTLHCGRIHLERLDLLDRPCVVAAMSESILEDPRAIADALREVYCAHDLDGADDGDDVVDQDDPWPFELDLEE